MATIERAEREDFDFTVPLAIVGAGAAGLTAALAARTAGLADVLLLERDATPAGSTALSAGLIPAPGTRWQRAAGIDDTPEIFAADIMKKAHGEPDRTIVDLVARESGPALEWLADTYDLPFSVIDDFSYPGHSRRRMHGLPTRSGQELVDRLRASCEAAGCEILCDSTVDTLFVDASGAVVGLAFERPDGTRERVGSDAIILACNGYGGNKAMVERHIPELSSALYFGHSGNRGEALEWGEALDADLRHLSGHQGHGSVAHPAGILLTWATMTEGGVQVNAAATRFSNEAKGYSEQAADVLRQPDGIAFDIFDARIAAICRQFEDFRNLESSGSVHAAATWSELAERLGLDPDLLEKTMRGVAALKEGTGEDPFGRPFAGVAQLEPPFLGVRVTGALFHTQGGLGVDATGRVLRRDGSAFPNLFAAGGAACGVSGSQASGYLSGNGLLMAVALGRITGRAAAESSASSNGGPHARGRS